MKNKEENHITSVMNDFIEIRKQVNTKEITSDELRYSLKKLKGILKRPRTEHIIKLIEQEIEENIEREKELDKSILPAIDKKIQEIKNTGNSKVKEILDFLDSNPESPYMTEVDRKVQYIRMALNSIKDIHLVEHHFIWMSIDDKANQFFNTSELIEWRTNRYKRNIKILNLEHIEKIKNFSLESKFHNKEDNWKFVVDNVCSAFIDMLSKANELVFIKIKKISYRCNKATNKARLKITINDEVSIFFSGKRAKILYAILNSPLEVGVEELDSIDKTKTTCEEENYPDKKMRDRVWKHVNAANDTLFKKHPKFGLTNFFVKGTDGPDYIKVCGKYKRLLQKLD